MLRSSSVSTLHAGGVDERHKKSLLRKYMKAMIWWHLVLISYPGPCLIVGRGGRGAGDCQGGEWGRGRRGLDGGDGRGAAGHRHPPLPLLPAITPSNIFTANFFPACLPVLLGGDVVRRGEAGRGVGEGVARAGPLQGDRGWDRGRGAGGGGERGDLGLGLAGIRNEIILIWSWNMTIWIHVTATTGTEIDFHSHFIITGQLD